MMNDKLVKELDEITKLYYENDREQFEKSLINIWTKTMGYTPNLRQPKTYNEKLLHMYLKVDQSKILEIVDKISFKKWLIKHRLYQYQVPTLAVFNRQNQITLLDLNKFTKPYIIKLNNSTENEDLYIVRETTSQAELMQIVVHFNDILLNKKVNEPRNFYETWCYSQIKPQVLVEPLLGKQTLVADYKIFYFEEEQFCLYMNKDEIEKKNWNWDFLKSNIFDLKNNKSILNDETINFDFSEIKSVCQKIYQILKDDFKHFRVDFYYVDHRLYIGEITFNTSNAFFTFWDDPQWRQKDLEWGKYWK